MERWLVSSVCRAAMLLGASACSLNPDHKDGTASVRVRIGEEPTANYSLMSDQPGYSLLSTTPAPNPPTSATGFNCYAVNVTGPGIVSADGGGEDRFAPLLARQSYCSYPGKLSGTLKAGDEGIINDIPVGDPRLIQVVGVQDSGGTVCTQPLIPVGKGSGTDNAYFYELGRVVTKLFSDVAIGVPNEYATLSTTDQSARMMNCGGSQFWKYVGLRGFSPVGVSGQGTKTVTDSNGTPHVIFTRSSDANILVYRYTSTGWAQVGQTMTTAGTKLRLAIDSSLSPIAGYLSGSTVNVYKPGSGGVWTALTGSVSGSKIDLDLAVNPTNNYPTVFVTDNAGVANVYQNDGTSWGSSLYSFSGINFSIPNLKIAISSNGTIYTAALNNPSNQLNLYANGAAVAGWTNNSFALSTGAPIELALDSSGNPYLAFVQYSSPNYFIKVISVIGGTMTTVGGGAAVTLSSQPTLNGFKIDSSGRPMVLYTDPTTQKGNLKVYEPASGWYFLGQNDFTNSTVLDASLAVFGTRPYVSFYDAGASGAVSVLSY